LDFGFWSKVERTALRALATASGASCELIYLEIDEDQQRLRRNRRTSEEPGTTFYISDEDLDQYRRHFVPPDDGELSAADLDPPPAGYTSWSSWASEWWPTSIQ
jgi:hypothetical protein